ncbi:MAG TPA: sodium:proton exchanger, partial [Burkholderiales bacterium]|nr:sodium:proton exchanger [Burkholderiales bacterium]
MQEPSFLPQLPLPVSHLMWFGVLLLAGLLAGELARRYARLPRVTGYVVVGALLGPEASGLLNRDMLFDLRLLTDLAIGIVVVELGFRVSLEWLARNRWLSLAALAESLLCFAAIFATLLM